MKVRYAATVTFPFHIKIMKSNYIFRTTVGTVSVRLRQEEVRVLDRSSHIDSPRRIDHWLHTHAASTSYSANSI